jgi:4-alpha-glucanotransferase
MNLNQRGAGILAHVTSLPGPHGVGDFGPEAHAFVDWLALAGQRLWQWLPTTPVGPGNSPYQSVSAFAGSPLMVALEPLVAQGWLSDVVLPDGGFDPHRVDFDRVTPWRLQALRDAHAGFEIKATPAQREALAAWALQQSDWLPDYELFMALESAHRCAWWDWPEGVRQRQVKALAAARVEHAREMAFWRFVQWCFDEQCLSLKRYANDKGVAILGDLPIFVAHHSADCWSRPDLYLLDEDFQPQVVAGVPPDDLGPQGQRWGNPLYRWDRMAADGYAWWTARVKRALSQADAFRIDHFRGFAGYFEIPASSPDAKQGRWLKGPGKPLFDAIAKALGALPIVAEDLGFITPDVHELRDSLGYPGMKIMQFAFGGDGSQEFLPHNYRQDVVVYTGTHDNDTVVGWWRAAPEAVRRYAGTYLACGEHDVHWAMVRSAMNSVANLAVFPLQDVMGLGSEARMNTPGTMGPHNWTWRFTPDQLGAEPARVLALYVAASGRGSFGPMKP